MLIIFTIKVKDKNELNWNKRESLDQVFDWVRLARWKRYLEDDLRHLSQNYW